MPISRIETASLAAGLVAPSATTATTATALTTASGSAPSYSARAWVNFDGTGTPSIRASGNVSSITDNGVGNYTVNLTIALPDANGAPTLGESRSRVSSNYARGSQVYMASASTAIVFTYDSATSLEDHTDINVAIFR